MDELKDWTKPPQETTSVKTRPAKSKNQFEKKKNAKPGSQQAPQNNMHVFKRPFCLTQGS